jgi:hypothetical protein
MKVTTAKVQEEFKPRTTHITFETAEEYELFRRMFGKSLTIPPLCCYSTKEQKLMTSMMVSVYDTMPVIL